MRYRERLSPPVWIWLITAGLVGMLAVAFGVALGAAYGWACFAVVFALAAWMLLATAPTICVTDTELRVGRAHLEWPYVGIVAVLDPAATKAARGTGADPRAFAVMRPLTAPASVTLEICDDSDPHPYWLITTRSPEILGERIRAARQAAQTSHAAQ